MMKIQHPTTAKYAFFSNVHGAVSRLGHIISLKKFERTKIIQSIFSNNSRMKLEITKENFENSQICGN